MTKHLEKYFENVHIPSELSKVAVTLSYAHQKKCKKVGLKE